MHLPSDSAGGASGCIQTRIDIFQLRAKQSTPDEIEAMSREILPLAREAGVPFIVNDFPEVAEAVGADGGDVTSQQPIF